MSVVKDLRRNGETEQCIRGPKPHVCAALFVWSRLLDSTFSLRNTGEVVLTPSQSLFMREYEGQCVNLGSTTYKQEQRGEGGAKRQSGAMLVGATQKL